MIGAILWDVDGTLVDSVQFHAEAWARTLDYFGVRVSIAEVHDQIGKGGDQLVPHFVPGIDEERRHAMEEWRSALFKREYMPRIEPLDGATELLRAVRSRGIRQALASSGAREEVERHLKALHAEQLLDGFTTADDADRSKPHPDIFAAALKIVAPLPPAQTIVVGDSPWDSVAARRAGLRTIGLRSGGFTDAQLEEAGVVRLYDGPADMLAHLDEALSL